MSSLHNNLPKLEPLAVDIRFGKGTLVISLADGREISMPLEWSEKLRNANAKQRKKWRLIGGGVGIHWQTIDEDILVESLLRG